MRKDSFKWGVLVIVIGLLVACGAQNAPSSLGASQTLEISHVVDSVSESNSLPDDTTSIAEKTYGYGKTINYDDGTDKEYVGAWKELNGEAVFILKEDGSCGFFKSVDDLQDNYYWGSHIGALQGENALIDIGIAENERHAEPYRDPSKTYSLRLWYDTFYSDGVEKNEMVEGKFHWFMFGIFSDGRFVFINMISYTITYVEKIDLDIERPVH